MHSAVRSSPDRVQVYYSQLTVQHHHSHLQNDDGERYLQLDFPSRLQGDDDNEHGEDEEAVKLFNHHYRAPLPRL